MSTRHTVRAEPTLFQVMRRPRWILALLLALSVAAGFAWLAQWQMDSAIQTQLQEEIDTETPLPLDELTGPSAPLTDENAGFLVTVEGEFVDGDTQIISERVNQGAVGYWVVGHLQMPLEPDEEATHIAVAVGWAATEAEAIQAANELTSSENGEVAAAFTARYMPTESRMLPDPEVSAEVMTTMVPAHLVNLWSEFDGPAYSGYLVSHDPPAGLEQIDSVPPLPQETINWLNLFYAAEWVIFGGFAIYFWYRLARDAWEKEHELRALAAAKQASDE